MSFYERLVKETEGARQELYTVPQLSDGLAGNISRATYVAYLTQAYHHVKHTVPFLMTMGVQMPFEKHWLHKPIIEYLKEEVGHEEWILNDIQAAGGDKEVVRAGKPSPATEALVAYNYNYLNHKNPVGFLGMVFMLESTSMQIATNGAEALKASLDLPKSAFTYLFSHGALDIEHMAFFKDLMEKIDDPADQEAIIEVANDTFYLFAAMMLSIPHDKSDDKAEVRDAA